MLWKTKGMNQDLSVSAFNPEFSFENMNLRLSTIEGNTLLSWVNEKGTGAISNISINDCERWGDGSYNSNIYGSPVGTAVLNNQLIIFTADSDGFDRIYNIDHIDGNIASGTLLFKGKLGFGETTLETLVSYEAEHVQKVYWTDGVNQPRVINIAADAQIRSIWRDATEDGKFFTGFDFVPAIDDGSISVEKNLDSSGVFAPGVIQYCFTYYNKYGQQSNIVDVSPLHYVSPTGRGGKPDEKVSNSFTVTMTGIDPAFEYARLYAIQRTSIDNVPFVRLLEDFKIHTLSPLTIIKKGEDDNNLTLPRTDIKQVVSTDEQNNYIMSVDGIVAFSNSQTVKIVTYVAPQSSDSEIELMSFNMLAHGSIGVGPGASIQFDDSSYFDKKYYAGFVFTSAIIDQICEYAESRAGTGKRNWKITVDGSNFTFNNTTIGYIIQNNENADTVRGLRFLYSYADGNWYISGSTASLPIITEPNPIAEESFTYVDDGISGSAVDPAEMLFIGGKEIQVMTMTDKSNTLFMGGVAMPHSSVTALQSYITNSTDIEIEFSNDGADDIKLLDLGDAHGVYYHKQQLDKSLEDISTFKGGDTYRFGFQLQKKTGEWSEPVWIGDKRNDKYPQFDGNHSVQLVYAQAELDFSDCNFDFSAYRSIRPVIVYPNMADREVLCQGVLNPTVFNSLDRVDNSPFAQASWYFRPIMNEGGSAFINSITSSTSDTNIYGNVSETSLDPDNIDLSTSEGYESMLTDVYVMVATIEDSNKAKEILKRSYFLLHKVTSHAGFGGYTNTYGGSRSEDAAVTAEYRYLTTFLGGIDLGNDKYAFLSTTDWSNNIYSSDETPPSGVEYIVYESGVTDVKTSHMPFKFYAGMQRDENNLFYYVKTSGNLGKYEFKFYTPSYYYNISYNKGSMSVTDLTDDFVKTEGSAIEYRHYKPLYNTSMLGGTFTDAACQIEIQGSGGGYGSVSNTTNHFGGNRENANNPTAQRLLRKPTSNTEFFVDASIVTLNSPDLEFDTNVQTSGLDGLNLRIVGAIPLTANVSAHHITTSSSMLENMHNLDINIGDGFKQSKFGVGELSFNTFYVGDDNKAGKHLVAGYLWSDVLIGQDEGAEDKIRTSIAFHDFIVYPWQRTGSLNNDYRSSDKAASLLRTKRESNLLFSNNSIYDSNESSCPVSVAIHLSENAEVLNYRLPVRADNSSDINYYPNVDKILYNENGYKSLYLGNSNEIDKIPDLTSPISMKYKSGTHAVLELKGTDIPILPGYDGGTSTNTLFWKNGSVSFNQMTGLTTIPNGNYLLLGELYRKRETEDELKNLFGGSSASALKANNWQVGGKAVPLEITESDGSATVANVDLKWTYGDTYYQRYDCLKTYAYTPEDTNQIVEVLSFMCETHVNLDGRYDRNRGQIDNTMMKPEIFNLLNPVYSQQDNFFSYKQTGDEDVTGNALRYPNQVAFSMTKNSAADVDEWTHVTMASNIELDGDKGNITKLTRFNDQLLAFQDSGVSQILYNENAAISTTAGVPIELANSGKVQGVRYLSDTIGCSNKWSVVNTPAGVYFTDDNEDSIYLFNGQFNNLSQKGGMDSWSKIHNVGQYNGYYDRKNQDVLFIGGNKALAWSEKLGTFTSFYDYSGRLCNVGDKGIWVTGGEEDDTLITKLWGHQEGEYCNFYGEVKPYWITLVGNPEPQLDKTFTNLEFRACVDDEGENIPIENSNETRYKPFTPFDSLETWNEYQRGIANFDYKHGSGPMKHHLNDMSAHLNRKFRIWRCDIPRDNASDVPHVLDRMRNPWIYITLRKDNDTDRRTEIHDVMMSYFV